MDAMLGENGGVRVMLDLAARWTAAGTPTVAFALQEATDPATVPANVRVVRGQRHPGRLRSGIPAIGLRFLAAARAADVIFSISEEGFSLLLAALGAAVLRRPLVIAAQTPMADSIRDWVPRPLRRLTFFVNRHAAATVCVSQGVAAAAVACGVPAGRVEVVTNGVDSAAIRARAALPMVDVPMLDAPMVDGPLVDGPPTDGSGLAARLPFVVAVGRLADQKGFDLLIRAHAIARRSAPHQLVIVGEGSERGRLERLADSLGVRDTVSLLGFRENPHAIMARADLFCLSSRYEGHPLILIEALAVGVPIVATDCVSGPAEILDGGRYGDLVPAGSVDALAAAISSHLADPRRLRELAALGPAHVAEFDPDVAAARYLDIFRSVTAA